MITQSRTSSVDRFLHSIARIGQRFISSGDTDTQNRTDQLASLIVQILVCRGEASVLALVDALRSRFELASQVEKQAFFDTLASDFGLDVDDQDYNVLARDAHKYAQFVKASKSRRQFLFQRISAAAGGIAFLVQLRAELGAFLNEASSLSPVDLDLKYLLQQWFTRGLLQLRRIDWDTSANILSKLQKYEAVHKIQDWDDLHRRLMTDRRCFGFFHPALADEPLIFIQVALTTERSSNIEQILNQETILGDVSHASHAIFYSISNCQDGLRGISFGSFLIKQVSEQLCAELPNLKHFMTLSPLPGFRRAVRRQEIELDAEAQAMALQLLKNDPDAAPLETSSAVRQVAAKYLTQTVDGKLLDPVARFHLGNGAQLHAINVDANMSKVGVDQSFGVMVNYQYDLAKLEQNHEQFHQSGTVAMSRTVAKLL